MSPPREGRGSVCVRGGVQGCPGTKHVHLSGCDSAGILFPPRAAWTACHHVSHCRRPGFLNVGIYERYLHLVGSTACLPSNRLLPLPGEMGKGVRELTAAGIFRKTWRGCTSSKGHQLQWASTWAGACQLRDRNKLCPSENTTFKSAKFVQKNVSSTTCNWWLLQEAGSGEWVYYDHFLAKDRYSLSLPSIAAG